MEEPIEQFEVDGIKVKIYQDLYPNSPDDWGDDQRFLVGFSQSDFWVERRGFGQGMIQAMVNKGMGEDGDPDEEAKANLKKYHVFLLEAYIHGGVALALQDEGRFPDRQWDVSNGIGAVLVAKSEAKTKPQARKIAMFLIKEWNRYLSGDVYSFCLEDSEGNALDSLSGIYGDEYAKEEAMEAAKYQAKKALKAKTARTKAKIKNRVPLLKR